MALHLITGGSGFVGSTIARLLAEQGEDVRILDIWQADDLPDSAEFVLGDINDAEKVAEAMRGVDYVHHNVALVPLAKAGALFEKVNVGGTETALRCAKDAGVKFFSHMSSSAIFGSPNQMPITNDTPLEPVEIYGRAKKRADDLARRANEEGSIKTCCVRPRTIVGLGRLGIFEILFDWIADNANIFIIGNGNHLFQFVHADDLSSVSILACQQEMPGLYNVGTDQFGTLREDLGALIEHAGKRSKVVGLPAGLTIATLRALDMMKLSPLGPWHYLTYHKPFHFDSKPVTEALGWKPRYSNQEILNIAYDWFIENRREAEAADTEGGGFHKKPVKQGILRVAKTASRIFG